MAATGAWTTRLSVTQVKSVSACQGISEIELRNRCILFLDGPSFGALGADIGSWCVLSWRDLKDSDVGTIQAACQLQLRPWSDSAWTVSSILHQSPPTSTSNRASKGNTTLYCSAALGLLLHSSHSSTIDPLNTPSPLSLSLHGPASRIETIPLARSITLFYRSPECTGTGEILDATTLARAVAGSGVVPSRGVIRVLGRQFILHASDENTTVDTVAGGRSSNGPHAGRDYDASSRRLLRYVRSTRVTYTLAHPSHLPPTSYLTPSLPSSPTRNQPSLTPPTTFVSVRDGIAVQWRCAIKRHVVAADSIVETIIHDTLQASNTSTPPSYTSSLPSSASLSTVSAYSSSSSPASSLSGPSSLMYFVTGPPGAGKSHLVKTIVDTSPFPAVHLRVSIIHDNISAYAFIYRSYLVCDVILHISYTLSFSFLPSFPSYVLCRSLRARKCSSPCRAGPRGTSRAHSSLFSQVSPHLASPPSLRTYLPWRWSRSTT